MDDILAKKPINIDIGRDEVLECMDAWAKQQTLAFIKWYFTEALKMEVENFDEGLLFVDLDNDKITKEQLFTLFLNDIK